MGLRFKRNIISDIVFCMATLIFFMRSIEARRLKNIESVTSLQKTLFAIGYEEERAEIVSLIKEVFPDLEELKTLPVEEKIVRLVLMIKEKIIPDEEARIFDLITLFKAREANCLGYSQLFYVLGREIGLEVEVISVYPAHIATLIRLDSASCLILDLMRNYQSPVFVWRDNYEPQSGIWLLKERSIFHKIFQKVSGKVGLSRDYKFIYILYPQGILAARYVSSGFDKAERGEYTEAINDYEKALILDPGHEEAFYNLGALMAELGLYESAIKNFDEAIALNPYDYNAFYNRGLAKAKLGRFKEAQEDFENASYLRRYIIYL
ncbi:MAG: tetratricopeptide repeat protein [Candidatus Omnitrophica bacterium]|nr:tetratricopeptide repeat protein [Candidatus Omnitrophota bacterium]